jgi:hypothetical protein
MPDEATVRTWRVTTTITVPTWVATGPGGGPPEVLKFESRLPEQSARYGDIVDHSQELTEHRLRTGDPLSIAGRLRIRQDLLQGPSADPVVPSA